MCRRHCSRLPRCWYQTRAQCGVLGTRCCFRPGLTEHKTFALRQIQDSARKDVFSGQPRDLKPPSTPPKPLHLQGTHERLQIYASSTYPSSIHPSSINARAAHLGGHAPRTTWQSWCARPGFDQPFSSLCQPPTPQMTHEPTSAHVIRTACLHTSYHRNLRW